MQGGKGKQGEGKGGRGGGNGRGEELAAAKSRFAWDVDSSRVFSSFLTGGLLETGPLRRKEADPPAKDPGRVPTGLTRRLNLTPGDVDGKL